MSTDRGSETPMEEEPARGHMFVERKNSISPNLSESEEVSKEIAEEDFTAYSNLPNLTADLTPAFGEGPSSEKYGKASSSKDNPVDKSSSSTPSELTISNQGTSVSTKELCEKESKGDQEALVESISRNEGPPRVKEPTSDLSSEETSKKVSLEISTSTTTEMTSPLVEIMTHDETCADEEEMKFDQKSSSQKFEEHDLMRLFQIMKEGAGMEVDLPYVSRLIVDRHGNKEVTKALADLDASLTMDLNEIARSEESRLRLHNALNILSSHCCEGGAPSHGLQATTQSLQQEIQTVLSSFNQAYATIDSFTKLEQTEKLMIEQRSKREKDAKTLLSDINNAKNSISEAQLNEAELKEKISNLQADLHSKEKEIEEYERKLLSLQEQEKKSVSDTIDFTMEFLAMEKEMSRMAEDQMKARQQLENMDAKWSSCLSNLKKATMLLGVHLKQKL